MRPDDAACAEFDVGINDRIRPDLHGGIELCFGRNDGRRMNHAWAGYKAGAGFTQNQRAILSVS